MLGVALGGLVASGYLVWIGMDLDAGEFDVRTHLPIHICYAPSLMLPLALTGRWPKLFEVVLLGAGRWNSGHVDAIGSRRLP